MRPLVIGSGPNGLSAAFYLAKAGHRPLVLERTDVVGGGAVTAEIHPGFRAPLYSHEILLHASIAREMDLAAHGLRWLDSDVEICAVAREGPPLVIYRDTARTAEEMRERSAHDAHLWIRYRETMARMAQAIAPLLTAAPPDADHRVRAAWDVLGAVRRFRGLGDRDARHLLRWLPMPVFDFAEEWFEDDLLRAAVAGPPLSGTMLGPRSAGSTLLLLLREAHAYLAGGHCLRAVGGPGACTRAMAAAARAAGADIRTGVSVERLLVAQGQIRGVVANGEELAADVVVSTLDPRTTLLALIDADTVPADVRERMRNYRASGTMAKVNLALSGLPRFTAIDQPAALAGHIHLGPHIDDLERAFDHVKYGEPSVHPWLDMMIPSVADAALAPAGRHVASIYVHNVPYKPTEAAGRKEERDALLERTLAVLEQYAPGTRNLVLAAQTAAPADLESALGISGGHIFHGELSPDQLFIARPATGLGHYRTPVEGLYLGGAGTHPGGFFTGASGRLAAAAALRAARATRGQRSSST